jgi:hypothetical protein
MEHTEQMEWIRLEEVPPVVEKRNLQGVQVDVLVSPYDVPEAVRGYFCHQRQRFIIEFKYISSEDTVEKPQDQNVKIRVGRHSGRLYAIELDVKSLHANAVQLRLKIAEALRNVLTHLIQQPLSQMRTSNYRLAKDAVDKHEARILQPV